MGQSGKRIALVIGNDAYQKVSKLEKAGNDATAMARELKAAGFEVLLHHDLNYRGMVKAVETLANSITGGDQVVVFFAGHGVQIKTGSYLLPVDIDATSESEVEKTAYGLADLTDKLSEAKASFALVMVDACRNNPLKSKGRSLGSTRGLSAIEPPKGQMVVYSASKGQQALDRLSESDNNPNGVFTREFIAKMKRPGVRIEDLVRDVQDSVEELARSISHDQRPALYNESRGNFYFFGPTTVKVTPQISGATVPSRARSKEEIEDGYWDSIQDSQDSSAIDAYLKEYPKGRYAAQARVTLSKLKAESSKSAGSNVAPTLVPVAIEDTETHFWIEVKTSGAREYLDAYLKQYPKGKYLALAKIELKKLDDQDKAQRARAEVEKRQAAERERQEIQRAELAAWDEAKAGASSSSYISYLERYPQGRFAPLAQVAQHKAQREASDQEKQSALRQQREKAEAIMREEADLWRQAENASNSATLQNYLDRYPAGRNANDAREKLSLLKKSKVLAPASSPTMIRIPGKNYEVGIVEVTQGQWKTVMSENPSEFLNCGDTCPVEKVNLKDIEEYIQKLNTKTGMQYRLLTKDEWEYACYGGKQTTYCGGNDLNVVAWTDSNSNEQTHPVGQKAANDYGLYDMTGNVWELTGECYGGNCSYPVRRGGSWNNGPAIVLALYRDRTWLLERSRTVGFRLARTLP